MLGDWFYHPTTLILIAVIALLLLLKHDRIFSVISACYPLIAGGILSNQVGSYNISLGNVNFIWQYSDPGKLISFAFLLVLAASNIFAGGRGQKLEVIFGSAYGAFAILAVLAEDFISMFIAIEAMMVLSSFIIFIGKDRSSPRAAQKYFITHLLSSNMILIGFAYLIGKNGSANMLLLTPLMSNADYSEIALIIMLTGLIINIAAFPFSGWMVNYYQSASPSGFLYLISFTTKVSIVLLIKLFAGYKLLAPVGTVMMIYSGVKALFEDRILGLLCHLSIMQMGFLLIGISIGSETAVLATGVYLFIHIIYKSLLSILSAALIEHGQIVRCFELQKIGNLNILLPLLIAIGVMVNVPASTSLYAKLAISDSIENSALYYIITLTSAAAVIAVPLGQYFSANSAKSLKLDLSSTVSIYFMTCILLACGFFGRFLPVISTMGTFEEISLFSISSMKQLIIIGLAIGLTFFLRPAKKQIKSLNLIEWIGNIFLSYYFRWSAKTEKEQYAEPWAIRSLERQTIASLASIHNQQTAIFITFLLLFLMLISFIIYTSW